MTVTKAGHHLNSRNTDPLPRSADGVVLRRLDVSDLAAFQAYRSDALLGLYQGWTPTPDAEATSFLAEMSTATLFHPGSWSQIGIAESGSERLVGDIGMFLSGDGQQVEIGFTLRRESQGRGIATTAVREAIALAFQQTSALWVISVTDARNVASIRLLERLGMRKTETRSAVFRGESCVEHVYATSNARAHSSIDQNL